jgi:hypothetical protein
MEGILIFDLRVRRLEKNPYQMFLIWIDRFKESRPLQNHQTFKPEEIRGHDPPHFIGRTYGSRIYSLLKKLHGKLNDVNSLINLLNL